MSDLPLLPSILPLEIRNLIYSFTDNKFLAVKNAEFFWAIAPDTTRQFTIGKIFNFVVDPFQTQLATRYPTCGRYVEKLTILTNPSSVRTITAFLENFPAQRKLKHLTIKISPLRHSYYCCDFLPYEHLLDILIGSTPTLTRLSFVQFQPSASMILCLPTLTHLDLGCYESKHPIPLPPTLEILSLTPIMMSYIHDPPPPRLRVLIVHPDVLADQTILEHLKTFIENCPSLTDVAIVDLCKFIYSFVGKCLIYFLVATVSWLIDILMDRLTPRVSNVCFKFTRRDSQCIRRLQAALFTHQPVFSICTILFPFNLLHHETIKRQGLLFIQTYNIRTCFVHSPEARYVFGTFDRANRNTVDEWLSVMDYE